MVQGKTRESYKTLSLGRGAIYRKQVQPPECENFYLQYFLGYESYRDEKPFDSSMMVYFRKRLNLKELSEINELIHGKYRKKSRVGEDKDKEDRGGSAGGSHLL